MTESMDAATAAAAIAAEAPAVPAAPHLPAAPAPASAKRKMGDVDNGAEAVTKAARPSASGVSAGQVVAESNAIVEAARAAPQTENKLSVFTMCNTGADNRLSAVPETDGIVAIGLLYGTANKVSTQSPPSAGIGDLTHTVLHYTTQALQETQRFEQAGCVFHKCENEVDMIKMFKAIWDQQDPDVVVGHQIMLFDLWYIIRRAAHLGVEGIDSLGKGLAVVSPDATAPASVIAGAGGASSYPVATHASKRTLRPPQNHFGAPPPQPMLPTFNRRIEVPGRKVEDIWERLQGRFSLKDYGIRKLTTNFLTKDKEADTPAFVPQPDTARIPAITAAHVAALSRLRDIVDSMPDFVAFCFRCKEPGHNAKQCKVGLVCNNCNQPGHKVTHCPSTTCMICGRLGHAASVCYTKAVCTKCGRMGHTASKCVPSMKCEVCGGTGHLADRCFTANPCKHCGGRHQSEKCYKNHVCTICGKRGHMEARCYNAQGGVPGGVPGAIPGANPMAAFQFMQQQQRQMQRPAFGARPAAGAYYQQQQAYGQRGQQGFQQRQPMAGQYNAAAARGGYNAQYMAQQQQAQTARYGQQAAYGAQAGAQAGARQAYGQQAATHQAYGQQPAAAAQQAQQQTYNAQGGAKAAGANAGAGRASWY